MITVVNIQLEGNPVLLFCFLLFPRPELKCSLSIHAQLNSKIVQRICCFADLSRYSSNSDLRSPNDSSPDIIHSSRTAVQDLVVCR